MAFLTVRAPVAATLVRRSRFLSPDLACVSRSPIPPIFQPRPPPIFFVGRPSSSIGLSSSSLRDATAPAARRRDADRSFSLDSRNENHLRVSPPAAWPIETFGLEMANAPRATADGGDAMNVPVTLEWTRTLAFSLTQTTNDARVPLQRVSSRTSSFNSNAVRLTPVIPRAPAAVDTSIQAADGRRGGKLKTRKAAAKRFNITGTGKVTVRHAGKNHFQEKKSSKRRNKLTMKQVASDSMKDNIKGCLPYAKVK